MLSGRISQHVKVASKVIRIISDRGTRERGQLQTYSWGGCIGWDP